jgi:hypothetical protein
MQWPCRWRIPRLRAVPPRRAGFPLAALLRPSPARAAGFASAGWRASGASATWSPPRNGCGLYLEPASKRVRALLGARLERSQLRWSIEG